MKKFYSLFLLLVAAMIGSSVDAKTLYAKFSGSDALYLYYWNNGPDWPGTPMSKKYDANNDVWYVGTVADDAVGVIFNNGGQGKQTDDITSIGDAYIVTEGTNNRYSFTATTVPTDLTDSPTTNYAFQLRGGFNSWGDTDPFTKNADGSYSITKSITDASTLFKVYEANADTWYGAGGEITREHSSGLEITEAGDNMTLIAGTYTFKVTISGQTFYLDVTPDGGWPATVIYISKAAEGKYFYAWDTNGNYGEWPGKEINSTNFEAATYDGKDCYKFEFTHKAAASSEHFIFSDGSQQTSDLSPVDGQYYIYKGGTELLDADEEEPVIPDPAYYLVGSFDNGVWEANDDYKFAVYDDSFVFKKTFDGGFEFKIINENGTWLGGGGNLVLTAENAVDLDVTQDTGGNFQINEAGTYTFIITDGKLTVTGFPEEPQPVTLTSLQLYSSSNDWTEPIATFTESESVGFVLPDQAVAAGEAFNVVATYSDEHSDWLSPFTEEGNFEFTANELGIPFTLTDANYKNFFFNKAGVFTFTVADDLSTITITGEFEEEPVVEITAVELLGSSNEWAEPLGTFAVEDASTGYWKLNEVAFAANDEFKIHVAYSDNSEKWLAPVSDGNFLVSPDYLNAELALVENSPANMYVENAATLSFALAPAFDKLFITGEIEEPQPVEKAYYLIGTFNDWNPTALPLVKQEDGSYVAENVVLTAGDEFLVYENSENAYLGPEAALTLSYDVPGANLVPSVYEANFKVESDVTLKVKVAVNESNQLYIHTEGWPEPQPEVLYYRIVGGFDNWDNPTVYDLTLNSETGYYESAADLAIAKGYNFKFNIYSDKGTSVWYGGNTDGDHWFDIMAEQFGNAISISESGSNIYFMKDATGVKFAVKADFSELIISGAYVPTVTLAEALAGAQAGVISDELTVVRVKDEFVYVTNGTDYLRLAGVENAAELEPGHVIAAEQIAVPVANPATNPTATVDGAVNATAGENVPEVAELNLRDGITTMPKPAQIVKITGYYVVEDGTPKFSAYSGKHGGNGNTIILNDAAGMEVDAEYTIEAAIELAAAWDSESTVTDVNTNLEGDDTITIGGGSSTQPGRVKASDKDAVSNLKLTVVGTPTATGVADLTTDKPVAGIQYVNVAGQVSAEPFDGINIVVTTYVDGTRSAVKVVK